MRPQRESRSDMTIDLPANANPKVHEALEDLLACVRQGFTGSLLLDFKDGIPLVRRRTETHRFGTIAKNLTPPRRS